MQEASSVENALSLHIDAVYRFVYRRAGNREGAEDLTTKTFLGVARHLDQHRPKGSIRAEISTVARNHLGDHWRRYYPHRALVRFDESSREDVSGQGKLPWLKSQEEQAVTDVLEMLPDRYRRVLELRFLRGCSLEETAKDLLRHPGTGANAAT